jgi:hypothetical protein
MRRWGKGLSRAQRHITKLRGNKPFRIEGDIGFGKTASLRVILQVSRILSLYLVGERSAAGAVPISLQKHGRGPQWTNCGFDVAGGGMDLCHLMGVCQLMALGNIVGQWTSGPLRHVETWALTRAAEVAAVPSENICP